MTSTPATGFAPAMKRAAVLGYLGAVVALVLAAVAGGAFGGSDGALGAVLGVAVPVGFLSVTVLVGWLTLRLSPTALGATVLGSWLIKIIVLIAVLVVIEGIDDLSRGAFFIAFVLATFGYLGLEAWVLLHARVPYIEPRRDGSAPPAAG